MWQKDTVVLLLAFCFALPAGEMPDDSAEIAAIKEVVNGETQAYVERDYDKWASYWYHGEDILRLGFSYGTKTEVRGWSAGPGLA